MRTVRVGGQCSGIVRSACQENGRVFGAFGDEDDGVELYAVAHGDHDVTPRVIEAIGDRSDLGGRFAGQCGGR